MTIRDRLARLVDAVGDRLDARMAGRRHARRDADLVVDWITRSEDVEQVRYPANYVSFMRQWHDASRWEVHHLKRATSVDSDSVRRFTTFVEQLETHAPSPPLAIARTAARAADKLLDRRDELNFGDWAGDVGLHFRISSSLARKGRLLCAAMRFLRPRSVLELGTAYGMSSLFMGLKLGRLHGTWSVTTVELSDRSHAVASAMLAEALGDRVNCLRGSSQDALMRLRETGASFDFFFHDAAHSMDAYVSDFEAAVPMLAPGAACLIDDIRWKDERFHSGATRTYEGWRHIVDHPRVIMAAELDQSIGLVLLS